MRDAPIRVMYLMDYYYGPRGGTEGQLLELIKSLDRKRFEPRLTVLRSTVYVRENLLPCPVQALNVTKIVSRNCLKGLCQLTGIIRTARVQLVHILFNDASMIAPLFCKMGGAKVVVSRRDLGLWYTPAKLAALKMSNVFVDRMVANSVAVKNNVQRSEKYPGNRIVVIHNGHAVERFKQDAVAEFRECHGIGADDPIVGMVANMYEMKRHGDLIKAFAEVRQEHNTAHLVFAGEGDEEHALRKLAAVLGIDKYVHFLGSVAEVIPVIKHFTVAVLCSVSEGMSNALIEYMGCGKPIVCTAVGGNVEVIRDGYNGLLVSAGDIKELAHGIRKLLADSSLAHRLVRNGAATLRERFGSETMVNSYMRLYEQMTCESNK